MTYEAAIAFAPLTTLERVNDPRREQRTLYDDGALRILPTRESVPVLVSHDAGQEIGRVTKLAKFDANGPWLTAIATLARRPSWLRRGTPASFRYLPLEMDSWGHGICRAGIVQEVSVLAPGKEPAEPLARVLYVRELAEGSSAAIVSSTGELLGGPPIRRPIGRVLRVA